MTDNTPPAGGAVAWCYMNRAGEKVANLDPSFGKPPANAIRYAAEMGYTITPLYTQPPATVPLDAVRGLVARLDSVTRYEAEIGGGCECCGSWVEHEIDRLGDWIKYDDLKSIRDELEALTRGEGNG